MDWVCVDDQNFAYAMSIDGQKLTATAGVLRHTGVWTRMANGPWFRQLMALHRFRLAIHCHTLPLDTSRQKNISAAIRNTMLWLTAKAMLIIFGQFCLSHPDLPQLAGKNWRHTYGWWMQVGKIRRGTTAHLRYFPQWQPLFLPMPLMCPKVEKYGKKRLF